MDGLKEHDSDNENKLKVKLLQIGGWGNSN